MSRLDTLSRSAVPVCGTDGETNCASETGLTVQMTAKSTGANRNPAVDFTKGALVLIMVLYHWINYFIGANFDYRYLRFLTPSFIFVSGFLISNVYISRSRSDPWRPSKRLLTRGLKLFAVFVVLNVARAFLFQALSKGGMVYAQLNPSNIWTVFVIGNDFSATGKILAFYILVPISYLLIFSAGLLVFFRFYKYAFHVTCVAFLLCILMLNSKNLQNANLEFVTIGLLGALVGFFPIGKIDTFVRRPYVLAFAYLGYLIAITFWNVPFVLLVIGTFLSLMGIYLMGLSDNGPSKARRTFILLGKYSLFGYVVQIAILQFLSLGLRHLHRGYGVIGISFIAAFALTILAVETVDRVKARSSLADSIYKAVFA
ncbi:MAG: acyltransferase family protein [Terriglobia bacterium]